MTDGPREELRALLFDSAPPAPVDGDALFARTLASGEGAGADLLPPDGLYDLPADDPDDGFSAGTDDAGADELADVGDDPDGVPLDDDTGTDPVDDTWEDPADPGDPAGPGDPGDPSFDPAAGW